MRAVKADLATPLREGVERVAEEEGPRLGKDASWRVQGGWVRRSRSRDHPCHPPECRMMRKWRERGKEEVKRNETAKGLSRCDGIAVWDCRCEVQQVRHE